MATLIASTDGLRPGNQILTLLPESDYRRISSQLEPVELPHGKILYETGGLIDYVYFPLKSMVSLVKQMADGKIIEVGLVGKEGMTGIAILMGETTSAERAIVQIPNGGLRAKIGVIKEEFKRGGMLQDLLLRYANGFIRQISQTAACNAVHTAEERLCRWLLMCQDRVASDDLNLTQEFLAEMIGTRRATVTVAAVTLQSAGLIHYNRGQIKIVDREGLESFSCECYDGLRISRTVEQ